MQEYEMPKQWDKTHIGSVPFGESCDNCGRRNGLYRFCKK
jgi:hypothetical protein